MSATITRHGASLQKASVGPYTLKGVKGHNTMDGYAYVASIYKDGKKIGRAQQDGRGGMTFTYFDTREDQIEFERYAAEDWNVTRLITAYEPHFESVENDAESFVEALMTEVEIAKRLNAERRKGSLPILLAGDAEENFAKDDLLTGWRSISNGANNVPGVLAYLASQNKSEGASYFDGTNWVPFV